MSSDARNAHPVSRLIVGGVLTALLAIVLGPARGQPPSAPGPIPTDPSLKVAFIGDSGNGDGFRRVLELIKSEGAHVVLHQGDFDYDENAGGFFQTIDSVLGRDFPFFASVGNHDVDSWRENCWDRNGCYAKFLKARMARIGVTPDDPDLDDQMYSATYRGLKLVFVGDGGARAGDKVYAPYITCKDLGAIIATAHEHSYQRTRTLTSMKDQVVDASCPDPNTICVAKGSPGKSFVFVSGLGGQSVRDQERCLPATFPYGCKGEWAKIYTSTQGATFGALFVVFNVDGDPTRAQGYFKNINGQIVDRFDITADASAAMRRARGTSSVTSRP